MRKILTIVACIVIALLALEWVPVRIEKVLTIKSKVEYADRLVSDPQSWKKWYSADSVNITQLQGLQYAVRTAIKGKENDFLLAIFSGELNTTKLAYIYTTSLLKKILPPSKPHEAEKASNGLKLYLEDSRLFYGFNIYIEKSPGEGVLSTRASLSKTDLYLPVKNVFAKLIEFCSTEKKEGLLLNNISFIPAKDDSVEIIAGIVVDKIMTGEGETNFMQVPEGQQLVVADYEGIYHKKTDVYNALRRYMADHNITGRADLYESFIPGTYPESDSSFVKMKVCFPFR